MADHGSATEAKIKEVMDAAERWGSVAIIALRGVPGTGKSYIASIAAQRLAGATTRVREIQFHQSFSYEEFIEGMRIEGGAARPHPGLFREWNAYADASDDTWVLLIDELTRADLSAVLGELLTYIEHRDRGFIAMYSREYVKVSPRLVIVTTYNPTDRRAIDIDAAVLRRLRIIDCPPDERQLEEMLTRGLGGLDSAVIDRLKSVFEDCKQAHANDYESLMPFGHGIFAGIRDEAELHGLWYQRIRYLLHPPVVGPHPFADTIREAYPWTDAQFRVPPAPPSPRPQTSHEAPLMEGGSTSADVASATDEGTLSDGR